MNPEKIGAFICSLRKKKNMTQSELAEKLSVTSQAVSKWENGRGIPDIELLKQMSELFQVDLETLLNGEEKKKKIPRKLIIICILFFLLILGIFCYFYKNRNTGFSFTDLVSTSEAFSVKGVAAYSDEQSSIFISDITYLGNETLKNYTSLECILYEEDGNVERKIGESANHSEEPKTLNDLLKQIEFHLDAFEVSCKNLSESSLYLAIHTKTKEEKTETYIVPLELTSCQNTH